MGIGAGVVAGGGAFGWTGEGAAMRGLFTLIGLFVCLGGLRIVDLVSSKLHDEDNIGTTEGIGRAGLTEEVAAMSRLAANGLWG